ncbi:hypothetical protein TNCV_5002821 [Trichonephila clavipes]|nr:hypothetical protein TNCV_5002821 [Trichonephila clavipes]
MSWGREGFGDMCPKPKADFEPSTQCSLFQPGSDMPCGAQDGSMVESIWSWGSKLHRITLVGLVALETGRWQFIDQHGLMRG